MSIYEQGEVRVNHGRWARIAAWIIASAGVLATIPAQAAPIPPVYKLQILPYDDLVILVPSPFQIDPNANWYEADFNGDGILDLYVQAVDGNGTNYIFYGNSQGKYVSIGQQWKNGHLGLDWSADTANIYIVYFDGDGRADIILESKVSGGTNAVLTSDATGRITAVAQTWIVEPEPTPSPVLSVTTTAVGAINGEFAVNAMGAATYRIPITVPPGINGMQPDISLNYNGQSGNGTIGMGWNIGGLSKITRCPRTIDRDGVTGGVNLDNDDRYCMDGMRLIAISGADGQEGTVYRTDVESFAKIVSHADPNIIGPRWFEVWTKDGRYYQYGKTDYSYAYAEAGGPTARYVWGVSRVQDTSGNYITYNYVNSSSTSEMLIESIDYTLNNGSYIGNSRSVAFEYTTRQDSDVSYFGGGAVVKRALLKAIRTKLDGVVVFRYDIKYEPLSNVPSSRSRISSVQQCAGDTPASTCFEVTTFGWQGADPAWTNPAPIWSSGPTSETKRCLTGDFFGEGRTEIACFNGSSGWTISGISSEGSSWVNTTFPGGPLPGSNVGEQCVVGDFDGNGMSDIACFTGEPGKWHVAQSSGYNWKFGGFWTGGPSPGSYNDVSSRCLTGDYDGDGRSDLACWSSGSNWHVVFSRGSNWESAPYYWGGPNAGTPIGKRCFGGDFNGDKKSDIACYTGSNGNWHVVISTGTNFIAPGGLWASGPGPGLPVYDQCFTGDFNGDGKTDITCWHKGTSRNWTTALSTGKGWATQVWSGGAFPGYLERYVIKSNPVWVTCRVGDYNGDGRSDIACYGPWTLPEENTYKDVPKWEVALSNGTGWQAGRANGYFGGPTTVRIDDGGQEVRAFIGNECYFGDFDGDARSDVSCIDKASGRWHMGVTTTPSPDLLATVTSPEKTISITHKRLSVASGSNYEKASGAVYPIKDVQRPLDVVSLATESDSAGSRKTVYTYHHLRENVSGRGNLGFYKITAQLQLGELGAITFYNPDYWLITTTKYNQTYPFIGSVNEIQTSFINYNNINNRGNLSLISYEYRNDTPAGISFPYVYRKIDQRTEITTAVVSPFKEETTVTFGFDSYGNPGSTTYTSSDGFKRVSNYFYYPADIPNWRLGKLFATKIESTVPATFSDTNTDQTQTRQSVFTYNSAGLLQNEIVQPNSFDPVGRTYTSGSLTLTTAFGYDSYGNVSSKTVTGSGVLTRTTTTTLNPMISLDDGRPAMTLTTTIPVTVVKKDPKTGKDVSAVVTHTETKRIDARYGVPTRITGPNGRTTKWFYDAFGRKAGEYRADNTSTQMSITACVNWNDCYLGETLPAPKYYVTSTDYDTNGNQLGTPTKVYFDSANRALRTETTSFRGWKVFKDTSYDKFGRVWKTSIPYYEGDTRKDTITNYDMLGRVRGVTAPDGSNSSTTFAGLTTTRRAPKAQNPDGSYPDQSRIETVNSQGQLVTVQDALATITYKYDPFGNLTKVSVEGNDGKKTTTTAAFNIRGFKTSMNDPDTGAWSYSYDVLGQLTSQTDAKNQVTSMYYDELGRMFKRVEGEGTSIWRFDTAPNGIGNLESVSGPTANGYTRGNIYDELGRLIVSATVIDGEAYYTTNTFDPATRRLQKTTYPSAGGSNLSIYYNYTTEGYVASVSSGANGTGKIFWRVANTLDNKYEDSATGGRDAAGRLRAAVYGNGMFTKYNYDETRNLLTGISTEGYNSGIKIQDLTYDYYRGIPNLKSRADNISGRTESFVGYDQVNRLTSVMVSGAAAPMEYRYDSLGNITSRSDVGTYYYDSTRPHAVTSVTGSVNGVANPSYSYDANGNQTSGGGRTLVQYTSFNIPNLIHTPTSSTAFTYNAEHERIKQVTDGETTIYVNNIVRFERVKKNDGSQENRHYIDSPDGPVAIYTVRVAGSSVTNSTSYLHLDHLGSVESITNESGTVTDRFRYDPFGKQIVVQNTTNTTDDGFTGHEMLNNVGLIHMNGRVYDPNLGRFIQPDPIVQFPLSSQSYNRYSYVRNNLLRATDPTGFAEEGECAQGGTDAFGCGGGGGYSTDTSAGWATGSDEGNGVGTSVPSPADLGGVAGGSGEGAGSSVTGGGELGGQVSQPAVGAPSAPSDGYTCNGDGVCRNENGSVILQPVMLAANGDVRDSPFQVGQNITVQFSVDSETGEHRYLIRGAVCASSTQGCTNEYADEVFSRVNRNDVPFTFDDIGEGPRNLLPYLPRSMGGNQPIYHFEYIKDRTSVNLTLNEHQFHPGTVVHKVHFERGMLYYDVIGRGLGRDPAFNNLMGLQLFLPGVQDVVDRFGR